MRKAKETKKFVKEKQGITLIALVITIIVLLILAGISIMMLTGDNSILRQATNAKESTVQGREQEAIKVAYLGVLSNNPEIVKEGKDFEDELQAEFRKNGVNAKVSNNGKTIEMEDTKKIYKLDIPTGKITEKEKGYDFYIFAEGVEATDPRVNQNQGIMVELSSGVNYLVYADELGDQCSITAERYVNNVVAGTYTYSSGSNLIPDEVSNEFSAIDNNGSIGIVIHGAVKIAPSTRTYGDIDGYLELYDEDTNDYIQVEKNWHDLTKDGLKTTRFLPRNCIDSETLVTMADGSQKKLGDIEVGDEVLSVDWDTKTLIGRKVIYTGKDDKDYENWYVNCYWENKFDDGTVIKQAMRHRFYCLEEEGFKHLHDWTVGLHTYKIDGTNPKMTSRTLVQGQIHYSRITLENDNNYFANGLLTGDSESQAGIPLTEFLPR